MTRYEFRIYKPNPNEDGDPYLYVITVFSREEAKKLCTLDNGWVANVSLTEHKRYSDDYGPYDTWEPLSSGSLEPDELHSNENIDKFLYPI